MAYRPGSVEKVIGGSDRRDPFAEQLALDRQPHGLEGTLRTRSFVAAWASASSSASPAAVSSAAA